MTATAHQSFADMFLRSDNQLGLCVVTVLSWIACSDGRLSNDELAMLEQIAGAGRNRDQLSEAIAVAQRGNAEDLQLALELCRHLESEARETFLEMAIGMAVADGALAVGENHIIRLIADLLGQTRESLDEVFRNFTGKSFPVPGDPSSVDWWDEREERWKPAGGQSRADSRGQRSQRRSSDRQYNRVGKMSRSQALSILGLDGDATTDEIKKAYRRMAVTHHPDRFGRMGPEAAKAAEVIFMRVQQAYETALGL